MAAAVVENYINTHGLDDPDLIDFVYNAVTKYGEAAGACAAEWYDTVAEMSGMALPPAEVAETPEMWEVAKSVNGTKKKSNSGTVSDAAARLVKRTGADTIQYNSIRDGAEWAWIPNGDTCGFCITLASRGWQRASKKMLKKGHAEHIHANCDCSFGVRFNDKTDYQNYDPEVYKRIYDNAEGSTPREKINSIRRTLEAEKREEQNTGKVLKEEKKNDTLEPRKDSDGYLVSKNELLDSIENNPHVLGNYTPESLKAELEAMGYNVKPLGQGNFVGKPFEEGGGYRVNYDGDSLLQYHPENRSHHEGAYYKLSNGEEGTRWYDIDGNEFLRRRKKQN